MLADRIQKAWPYSQATTTAIILFAAGIAFLVPGIGFTDVQMFDEQHYVPVAQHYAAGELVDPAWGADSPRPYNFEHPPLVKYAMGLSVAVLGDHGAAWRLPNALMAAAGYAVAYLLARNLFRSHTAGLAAAGFLALDPFYFLHARTALLDVFPAVLTAAAAALVLDPKKPRHLPAGILLGLAIGSKYTALLAAPAVLLLALWRHEGTWKERAKTLGLAYVLVPGLVMLALYLPYLLLWTRDHGPVFAIQFLAWLQWEMVTYGYGAEFLEHGSATPPHEWFLFTVPLLYYYEAPSRGVVRIVYTVGNPATWWPAVYAAAMHFLPALHRAGATIRQWDGLRIASVLGVITFVPYLLIDRITFIFYAVQFTPLFAVISAGLFHLLWQRPGPGRALAILYASLVAAHAVLLYPIADAGRITDDQVRWLFDGGISWLEHVPRPGE